VTSLAEYKSSRELFYNLTLRELRSKYKRSFLGWTWSMVNPLVNTMVYTIVFLYFLHIGGTTGEPSGLNVYALHLLCAMLPFNFFQNCVFGCMGTLIGNGNLIKKTYFPRDLMPAAAVGANLVSHAIEMGILVIVLLCFGQWRLAPMLPLVVFLILVTALFSLGFGMLVSILNVYFRDVEHFMAIFFLVWMYGTPIIYTFQQIGNHPAIIDALKVNPMTDMATAFQSILYDGKLPSLLDTSYYVVSAVVIFVIGYKVFLRLEGRLAEEL
jgi:ABC-type polysaccharide/polyol phosphate export permease